MTDRNLVTKKLNYMADALRDLKDALGLYYRDKENERFYYYAAQKKAEEIVESAISVNQIILMDKLSKQSENYYKSFSDLAPLKIFSHSRLEELAKTTGFRNRLAHEYVNLDTEVTVKSMEKILKIYPDYIKKVADYID